MGTPDFAVPSLEQLAAGSHEIVAVVTRQDKPRGRGRGVSSPEVKVVAEALGLPVLQPDSLKDPEFLNDLASYKPDLFAVVAFLILPQSVLQIPRLGSVNVHPSMLPRYRGAAPIQWAVIRGEKETGVTIFQLSGRVDAGDILKQERVVIGEDETAGELYERLKVFGANLLVKAIDELDQGVIRPVKQTDEGVTKAPKLEKEDGRIKWEAEAETIRNLIRGTNPVPGAFTEWQNKVLKIHRAEPVEGIGKPGEVIAKDPREGIQIAAGKGAVALLEVQPAGKRAMDGAAFARGYPIEVGEILG